MGCAILCFSPKSPNGLGGGGEGRGSEGARRKNRQWATVTVAWNGKATSDEEEDISGLG
jgi:hypothetical protein